MRSKFATIFVDKSFKKGINILSKFKNKKVKMSQHKTKNLDYELMSSTSSDLTKIDTIISKL
jgi:hypothetical protein